jgi:hypothetical protein
VSLQSASPEANKAIAYMVLDEIKASPLFDQATKFTGNVGNEEAPGTFTFGVDVKLKRPIKL